MNLMQPWVYRGSTGRDLRLDWLWDFALFV